MRQTSMDRVVHGAMNIVEFWYQNTYRNQYVIEKEFAHLYVRKGPTLIHYSRDVPPTLVDNCLHIANVAAKVPQSGAFGRLLAKIDRECHAPVFVENITRREVAEGLVRKYGFSYVNDVGVDFCFCLFREAPDV